MISNISVRIAIASEIVKRGFLTIEVWLETSSWGCDCTGCTGITKSGTVPQEGRTIAVDPSVIPLGTEVMFNGEIYLAEDIGGAIKGNVIDLFYGTEQDSMNYGVQFHTVYVRSDDHDY